MGERQEFSGVAQALESPYSGHFDAAKAVIRTMYKHDRGFDLYCRSDVPPRSGLGGSASVFGCIIGAFNYLDREYRLDKYELAEMAYRLERIEIGNEGGRQDQYAAFFGGINFMEFKGNDFVQVNPLKLDEEVLLELEANLLLFNIGPRQDSGKIIEEQKRNIQEKGISLEATHRTKELAKEVKYTLLRGELDKFGLLLHQGWEEKKKFSSQITNPYIDELYDKMRSAGALGGKITGAGGGGHMLIYAPLEYHEKVIQSARSMGAIHVEFGLDFTGQVAWQRIRS
jgi:D-glycero-alpha-D-manno-heptose-7-phosphate kinase